MSDGVLSNREVLTLSGACGSLAWGPAADLGDGALAVMEIGDGGERCERVLVRFGRHGEEIARTNLRMKNGVHGGAIGVLGGEEALVACLDRVEKHVSGADVNVVLTYDRPHWFGCHWDDKSLKAVELANWSAENTTDIAVSRRGQDVAWVFIKRSFGQAPNFESTRQVAVCFAGTPTAAGLMPTSIACGEIDHQLTSGQECILFGISGYREGSLWRVSRDGATTRIETICGAAKKKVELSSPRILRLADGFAFLWREFNGRIRKEERDGGIWMRTCDPGLSNFDEPRRVSPDRDIAAGAWNACSLASESLIVWRQGLSRKAQKVKSVRLKSRSGSPEEMPFPGLLPDRLVPLKEGVLSLATGFDHAKSTWSLHAITLSLR